LAGPVGFEPTIFRS